MRIARVLRAVQHSLPPAEARAVTEIEAARAELLTHTEPLVDGTLAATGPYDAGTVKFACEVSKAPKPALLLYHLVREFEPEHILELGTNVGISAAYLAAASRAYSQTACVTTLEASPYRLRLAKALHARLGLNGIEYVQGLFADTLAGVADNMGSVDLVFIDGHHQREPTLAYFETIWAHARPGAVFVFDDIRWSAGMRQAWSQLKQDERFSLVVDIGYLGICVARTSDAIARYASRRMYHVAR